MTTDLRLMVRDLLREELPNILPAVSPFEDDFLRTKDVAELTGLSTSFFEVARSHNIPDQPPYRKIGRAVVYRRAEVLTWMENRRKKGGASC